MKINKWVQSDLHPRSAQHEKVIQSYRVWHRARFDWINQNCWTLAEVLHSTESHSSLCLLCVFCCLNGEDDKRCHYDLWNHGDGCSLVLPITFFHNAAFLWLRPECNYRQNKTHTLQILNTTVSFSCAGSETFNWLHTDMFVDLFHCFWCECAGVKISTVNQNAF